MANFSNLSTTPASSQEAFIAALDYWASGAACRRAEEANDAAGRRELALYRVDRAYDAAHSGFWEAC